MALNIVYKYDVFNARLHFERQISKNSKDPLTVLHDKYILIMKLYYNVSSFDIYFYYMCRFSLILHIFICRHLYI